MKDILVGEFCVSGVQSDLEVFEVSRELTNFEVRLPDMIWRLRLPQ